MSQKVFKLWMIKSVTKEWFELPEEEADKLWKQMEEVRKKVGGKSSFMCNSYWANEKYQCWGIDEFPDLEAAIADGENLRKLNWGRYFISESILGIEEPGYKEQFEAQE